MPTLYVENLPEDLYEALRSRARSRGRSISAEVIVLLQENVPTADELARREQLFRCSRKLTARRSSAAEPVRSSEEMLREDRER